MPEHGAREVLKRSAQVRHGEAAVDGDALDLVEHGRVRRVELVLAEHLARAHHVHRQVALQQRADLHRAGLGAQHQVAVLRRDEEGVLVAARRVVLVHVERVEVEPLVLELGAFGHLPAHRHEDVAHLLHQKGERMPGSGPPARRQRGHIDRLAREARLLLGGEHDRLLRGERLVHAASRLADELAGGGLLVGGHVAHAGVELGQRRRLSGVGGSRRLQGCGVGRVGDGGERRADRGVDRLFGDLRGVGHERRV